MIEHTYRAAVKCGEDSTAIEQKLILPPDATDDEIAQAISTAERIYAAQHESVERQIAQARVGRGQASTGGASYSSGVREPEAPATTAQRRFVDQLRSKLGWSTEQLSLYTERQGIDLDRLTKGQASTLIEALKADPPPAAPPPPGSQPLPGFEDPPPPEPNGDDGQAIIPF